MSFPLCAIGDAVLEAVGLSPVSFGYRSEAHWPAHMMFDDKPFYQSTGLGERVYALRLAARPHVMGGLEQWAILKAHHEAQDVVTYMRLSGLVGLIGPDVAITSIGQTEEKIAPDGFGWRWEFDAELKIVNDASPFAGFA